MTHIVLLYALTPRFLFVARFVVDNSERLLASPAHCQISLRIKFHARTRTPRLFRVQFEQFRVKFLQNFRRMVLFHIDDDELMMMMPDDTELLRCCGAIHGDGPMGRSASQQAQLLCASVRRSPRPGFPHGDRRKYTRYCSRTRGTSKMAGARTG